MFFISHVSGLVTVQSTTYNLRKKSNRKEEWKVESKAPKMKAEERVTCLPEGYQEDDCGKNPGRSTGKLKKQHVSSLQ